MKRLGIGLVLIVLALWLSTTVVSVQPAQYVVVTRLGRPIRVLREPGPSLKLPWPLESTIVVGARLNLTEISPLETLTKDKKNLVLSAFAVWRVKDPLKFIASVQDVKSAGVRIGDMVASMLGNEVASLLLSSLINVDGKTEVRTLNEKLSRQVAKRCMEDFGVEVEEVRVSRMVFPEDNLRHVFNRMRAERQRIAKKYRAEGEEKAMKVIAQTDLEVRKVLSEATLKSMKIQAEARAQALRLQREAYRRSPQFYKFYMKLQAIKEVLKRGGKFIVSTKDHIFDVLGGMEGR